MWVTRRYPQTSRPRVFAGPGMRDGRGMGIRYYAYPVHPDQIEAARREPFDFLSPDPLMDAWGPADERPRMLYLDKCWYELQRLLAPAEADPRPRMAFELVRGAVQETDRGYIPYTAVHDPDVVAAIALDLERVRPVEDDAADAIGRCFVDAGYINSYLAAAQQFTSDLAAEGFGLVYLIG